MYFCRVRDFDEWRASARPLLSAGVQPESVTWSDGRKPSLFAGDAELPTTREPAPAVPRDLLALLENLACYRDEARWELMYRVAWRVVHENRCLLENEADPDVRTARLWSKAVQREIHRMHAFVRFHETSAEDGSKRYGAWFEPEHDVLRAAIPFFEKRFPNMSWTIATPDGAAVWNGTRTEFIDAPQRSAAPTEDATHELWRAYYRNICNVARINPTLMQRDMPQRYWKHLPEAREIDPLLRDGARRLQNSLEAPAAAELVRASRAVSQSLQDIAVSPDSLMACRRCELWRHATQAVAGEGPEHARIMLVGEQPGDEEDLRGRPFAGPAGRLLDEILASSGLDRSELFITNAVKHFKWEPRGKRRLHRRPDVHEIRACGIWLDREIAGVAPRVIVALGATALRAVTGLSLKIEEARQSALRHPLGASVVCSYHPSAILRAQDDQQTHLLHALEDDLRRAASMISAQQAHDACCETAGDT